MPVELKRRELFASGILLPTLLQGSLVPSVGVAESNDKFETLLRPTVYSAAARRWTLAERMAHHHVPGVAVGILSDGRLRSIRGYGTRSGGTAEMPGPLTMFSVGSVSKVVTAALCLRLVALGHLDLDRDIGHWLKRWRVPPGPEGDTRPITLRMLLSHSAGFNVHGFADFVPDAPLPTLVDILTGTAPAKNAPLRRVDPAGMRSRYSGGGYMIIQAVLEDAMRLPLDVLARRHVFAPLGMRRSSFSASLSPDWGDVAHAHDGTGRPAATPRGWQSFPELAASGLWTCAHDLAKLVAALIGSHRGTPNPFLPRNVVIDMMTPVAPGVFGLGPRIGGEGPSTIFHHGGANDSYKAYIEGNLASGDGLVILTNGANGDLLGDEIRNAISDALAWPGDWSVVTQTLPSDHLGSYVGRYSRRADQPLALAGPLDTGFRHEFIDIQRTEEGLALLMGDRSEPLAPLTSSRFVVPGQYVPAGTLQLEFKRDADRSVRQLVVSGGGGLLLFERV